MAVLEANKGEDRSGREPIVEAEKEGRLYDVTRLLDNHVAIDCVDEDHCTPLIFAARAGHLNVVQLLIQHGVNVDASDVDSSNALMEAAIGGQDQVAQAAKLKSTQETSTYGLL